MKILIFTLAALFFVVLVGGSADNPKDEFETTRKAAEQGHADAQFYLGVKYANGEGVPKDSVKAVEWYRKAAEQGDADAQFYLGVKYARGEGVPKDLVLAYMSLNLAMSPNLASVTLSEVRKARDDLAKSMTPDQISEAQRLSHEWKPAERRK
jgi:TPR repeat protein